MAKNLKVRKPNVTVTQKDGMFDPASGDVKTVTAVTIKPRMESTGVPAHVIVEQPDCVAASDDQWVTQREFPILKAQLTNPMIFGDKTITPFSDEAARQIRNDMELPIDTKVGPMCVMDDINANQFRAAIQFDDDLPCSDSLIHVAGMFSSPEDDELWCKVAAPDPETDECGYVALPPCPMIFGNNRGASGVFVPFNCSEVGLNNAHKMIDSFCGPLAQSMASVGISPLQLYSMIGPHKITYPCDEHPALEGEK